MGIEESTVEDGETDTAADEAEVVEVLGIDSGVAVDLERVVALVRLLELFRKVSIEGGRGARSRKDRRMDRRWHERGGRRIPCDLNISLGPIPPLEKLTSTLLHSPVPPLLGR